MMGSNKMILPHSSRLLILPPNINDTIKSEEKKGERKKQKKASHSHNQEVFVAAGARGDHSSSWRPEGACEAPGAAVASSRCSCLYI